ncbi:SDR family oxidoreductase [Solitalea sp. MAHUQ-68]|uniref:SDR family oxidoreductase n=1 Tax=Solitalea agri TaxID=2953739 RepID=A0A9X2JGH9_9SPHI|nr:SDR family oxidoreductase [Solitalea agri]MCO4294446.1 SDR family oxidoreductase [Solitalea agri]
MEFLHKRVWITGASSGIGESLAYAFANEGAHLILSGRNLKELERVKLNCKDASLVELVPLDISNHQQLLERVEQVNGPIDILINNAGISQRSLLVDTSFEVEKQMIDVNLLGTIAMTKAILPRMLQQRSGKIVTVSSIMGKLGAPLRSAYAASKHGLHGYFDTLRAECYKDNIKVLIVCPGYVQTNISINALTANGTTQGTMDAATAKGLKPEVAAQQILKAISSDKEEVIVAALREQVAVLLKRFTPGLLSKIIRKAKTV